MRSLSARKNCLHCGAEFRPWRKVDESGRSLRVCKEKAWDLQTCCSISCAKKHKNPMSNNQARIRMRETLRRIKHRPIRRGGNGRPLPLPQLALLHVLGEGWESEVAVATKKRADGYPTCFKIDIANTERMMAIELDGVSHSGQEMAEQDRRKQEFLESCGWRVFRVPNADALRLYSTFESVDTLLTSLEAF